MVSFVNNPNFVNDLQGVGIAGLRDGSVVHTSQVHGL